MEDEDIGLELKEEDDMWGATRHGRRGGREQEAALSCVFIHTSFRIQVDSIISHKLYISLFI